MLAACGSASGASRGIFRHAGSQGWTLISTPYALDEVLANLGDFPPAASPEWVRIRQQVLVMDDVLTVDRPVVFPAGKDRPILFNSLSKHRHMPHAKCAKSSEGNLRCVPQRPLREGFLTGRSAAGCL